MPKILILGATGYLGLPLSLALLRNSHTVYGLASSPAKAALLARQEIIPVLGTASDSTAYLSPIESAHIDIVIDCSAANAGSAQILEDCVRVGKKRLEHGGPKLGFIYTSGMWVHGSSTEERVNDLDPVDVPSAKRQPAQLVAWRPELERKLLAARDVLNVIVLRPALLYGRECPIWSEIYFVPVLSAVKEGKSDVELAAKEDAMPVLVHVDDVVSGFVAAAERLEMLSGSGVYPVFDLSTSTESMKLVLEAIARGLGFKGNISLIGTGGNVFAEAMNVSMFGDSGRAKKLLGWEPKRNEGMVGIAERLARAFAASRT